MTCSQVWILSRSPQGGGNSLPEREGPSDRAEYRLQLKPRVAIMQGLVISSTAIIEETHAYRRHPRADGAGRLRDRQRLYRFLQDDAVACGDRHRRQARRPA